MAAESISTFLKELFTLFLGGDRMTSINSTWPHTVAMDTTPNDTDDAINVSLAGNLTRLAEAPQCLTFRIVFYFCICGTLCILGIMGNTLSILILQKDRSNAVAAFLLQALAVADNSILLVTYIVLSLFYAFLPAVLPRAKTITAAAYVIKYLQPLAFMSHTATIWVTVLLAMNRYIAICRPFDAPSWCTKTKSRIQVAVVFSFAILYNFPRFFQTYFREGRYVQGSNETSIIAVQTSSIGENSLFGQVYTNALYSILVVLTPLTMIIVLNTLIIQEMKRMKSRRVSVSSDRPIREESITKVMVVIMIMVVCCHVPDRILVLIQAIDHPPDSCTEPFYYIQGIVNLLMILNSSTNFLIYYILRHSFRKILRQRLCGGKQTYHLSACEERLTNGDINMLDRSSIRTRDTCTNVNINNNLHQNKRLIKALFNNI